ncbi:hypothetical protein AB837_00224 [bacterium AB1]|nr:hypothetical protein AB837_00224 [bacterium AB1]
MIIVEQLNHPQEITSKIWVAISVAIMIFFILCRFIV